jgi:predicted RNase H-like HicB family nuclease
MAIHKHKEEGMRDIAFTTHIFKEGESYVAYVPELDVSSCGETANQARINILDAVRGFLETCADMGTLNEILDEAGYRREGDDWLPPEFVSIDRLTLSVK